jgi:hypothetical protein
MLLTNLTRCETPGQRVCVGRPYGLPGRINGPVTHVTGPDHPFVQVKGHFLVLSCFLV